MAIKTQVILIDDVDGSEAQETVAFGIDGATYEIDLSAHNAARIRSVLDEFVGKARKADARRGRSRRRARHHGNGPGSAAVRAWARENGIEVNERGRIPADLEAKYLAAQGS